MSRQREKLHTRSGVLVCGAYGMSNGGDEAILQAVVDEMRGIDQDMPVTVLSRMPEITAKDYGVKSLHMFDIRGFLKVMRSSRLYVNGGGSLIQDATSSRSLWYYLYTLMAAKHRGCKVLLYGCGIGPVRRRLNRRLAGWVLNRYVDAITLRETDSLEELRAFGVKKPKVTVTSDPAMTLSGAAAERVEAHMHTLGLDPAGKYICFCLRPWAGFEAHAADFARAAEYAHETYGLTPVFLSVNSREDGKAAEAVTAQLRCPFVSVAEPLTTGLVIGLIAKMQAVVSVRLHGLIFAASQGVPIAGVVYDPKISAFLDYIGQHNYIPLEAADAFALQGIIDLAVQTSRDALRENADRLKALAAENAREARRLLNEE